MPHLTAVFNMYGHAPRLWPPCLRSALLALSQSFDDCNQRKKSRNTCPLYLAVIILLRSQMGLLTWYLFYFERKSPRTITLK